MSFKDWSTTAANNDNSDAAINWSEGQAPSTVNGSARGMMAVLKNALGHVVSVVDYGATGDGSTDDTAAIQAAITAGGVIYFPKPSVNYKLTSPVTIASNKHLIGLGMAEIHQATTQIDTFQINDGSSNIIIEGFLFSGTGVSTTGKGSIHFIYSSGTVTDVFVRNNKFTNPSTSGVSTDPSQRVVISGNTFNGTGDAAIYLSNCLDCAVTGNVIIGGAETDLGIQVRNGTVGGGRIAIVGNVVRNIQNAAQAGILFADANVDEVTIAGNIITDNAGSGVTVGFSHAGKLQITGNTLSGNGNTNIELAAVTDAIISGNLITTSVNAGIFIGTDCRYLSIVGNKFFDNNSANNAYGSIYSDTGEDGNHVIANNYVKTQYGNSNGITTQLGGGNNFIFGNDVSQCAISEANRIKVVSTDRARHNRGWTTENGGTGSIASGATTATVNHGCQRTPTAAQISVVFTEQGTNDYGRWWIDNISATQFRVNVSTDPGASNLDFSWAVTIL